mmetsp:Transcript_57044/g.101244  ORF Transcript_57044/g.101244 Transcript_57044/m.101244 type:complete len:115 (+) Transcript_57044:20-364(+)
MGMEKQSVGQEMVRKAEVWGQLEMERKVVVMRMPAVVKVKVKVPVKVKVTVKDRTVKDRTVEMERRVELDQKVMGKGKWKGEESEKAMVRKAVERKWEQVLTLEGQERRTGEGR